MRAGSLLVSRTAAEQGWYRPRPPADQSQSQRGFKLLGKVRAGDAQRKRLTRKRSGRAGAYNSIRESFSSTLWPSTVGLQNEREPLWATKPPAAAIRVDSNCKIRSQ